MSIFKKREKKYKPTDFVIVEKWGATFRTVDGEEQSFKPPFYIDPNTLRCSIPEWIMIDIKSQGYILVGNTVYTLSNIVSMEWHCVETWLSLRRWKSKVYDIPAIYYFPKNIEECKKILGNKKYDEMIKERN